MKDIGLEKLGMSILIIGEFLVGIQKKRLMMRGIAGLKKNTRNMFLK